MEFWFSELHTGNVKLSVRIEKQLFSGESEYQRIDVFDSEEFGKFISLDGEIVFSEKDEFIYDEMVTHVPMAVHPHVKNVLIIGGSGSGKTRFWLKPNLMQCTSKAYPTSFVVTDPKGIISQGRRNPHTFGR